MIKLYQHIIIIALAAFLFGCEQDQVIKSQDQNQEFVFETDPEFLKEQAAQNKRTAANTVKLNRVRVYLQRDQWAGGQYRFVIVEKTSNAPVATSSYRSVTELPVSNQLDGFATATYNVGNITITKGVKYKINLEFTHPYEDVGKVHAAASTGNAYANGCGVTCNNDLAFQTRNQRSDGTTYDDQVQNLKQKRELVNKLTTVGQEFVPQ